MGFYCRVLPLLCILAGCTTAPERPVVPPAPKPAVLTGKVVSVADGDTVTILGPGREQVKVRFWGIDTPERAQAFGTRARQFTGDLVFGKQIEVETKDVDQYGRTLGIVRVAGKNVNLELLKAGMAWWYRHYAPEAKEFQEAERTARDRRVGLWSDPKAKAPWDFRREDRNR